MKKSCLTVLLIMMGILNLQALPFIGADTGLLFIINTEAAGAPSPVILQGIGVTIPVIVDESTYLETGILLFGTPYQYTNNRAIPADTERADTVWTLLVELDLRTGFIFRLNDKLWLGSGLQFAFILPLPLFAADNGAQYIDSMYSFFYSKVKFIYLGTELLLRWAIANAFNLTFKGRALYPLASLWDDPSVSRLNGLTFQLLVSIEIKL